MNIKVSDYISGRIIYSNLHSNSFGNKPEFEEVEHRFKNKNYSLSALESCFSGTRISVTKIDAITEGAILIEHLNQSVVFLFCINGTLICKDINENSVVNLSKNEQCISAEFLNNFVINFKAATEYVCVQLTMEHYKSLTGANFIDDASAFEGSTIEPEVALILHDLVNQKNHNRIKKIFLEAQIYKLLTFFINKDNSTITVSLKREDIKKILYAKQLVDENIQRPNSLLELSRKAGINDNKLKKGFKELTGETVFGYLSKIRMEKAYYYLSKEMKTVNEVAFLVGYKNAQHFTVAFKKRYNILPGSLNKIKRFLTDI